MKASVLKIHLLTTTTLVVLAVTAARAQQSALSTEIQNLNAAGYWPMHETNLPGANDIGDIETNYGTLGAAGNGYYPDWCQNSGAFQRNFFGPITVAGNSDTGVNFTRSGNVTGAFTNVLYIPHSSPLTTLNPPFTVETWYYVTNITTALTLFGQFGFQNLNAGTVGGGNATPDNGSGLSFNQSGSGVFALYGEVPTAQTLMVGGSGPAAAKGKWCYIVITCDAQTNFNLYTNDAQVGSQYAGVGKYAPDFWDPLTLGGSRGYTRVAPGVFSEFAVYTNVLQSADIAGHYADASVGAGQYFADVMASNPAVYLRLNAPAYAAPAAANWEHAGNFGTTNGVQVGAGVYAPGTVPGILSGPVNPTGVVFQGVTNNSALFSGVSSFVDVGSVPTYNPTGAVSFAVGALFRGYPCDGRVQSIFSHGTNSWELTLTTNGCLVFNSGTNSTAVVATSQGAGDLVSTRVLNDGNWHFVVATHNTTTNMLFVDGLLNIASTNATTNFVGNAMDAMIGSDPNYTNNPVGVGRQFAGQICDVAFWTNALTAGQVQLLYSNCEVAPTIITQPQSYSVNQGIAFTNIGVAVNGSPALGYQWFTNGVAFGGQTNANLILNPVTAAEAGTDFYVVVTNLYGAATSGVASLTVFATPLFSELLPVTYNVVNNTDYLVLYPGTSPGFTAVAQGAQPMGYFWFTNGVNLAGQNNTNVALANMQIGTINVSCVASNSLGMATNIWSISVIAAPTNSLGGPAPYPQQVLADNPLAYWRLNDYSLEGDNQSGDDGYYANDYAGGNNGFYTNVYLGQTSYSPSTDPSDSSVYLYEFGGSFPNVANNYAGDILGIDFATPTNTDAEFTVEAWANANQAQQSNPGAIITQGKYGISDAFFLGLDSAHHYEFYVRNSAGRQFTADSSLQADGNWHHVAGVCDETNGVISLYVDGHLAVSSSITAASGLYESAAPITIGAGTADGINYVYQFLGYLNDVAVYNHALPASAVALQYVSLGYAPTVSPAPPTTVDVNGGGTLTIPAIAVGTPISGYYWTDENAHTNVAAGTTNGAFLNATLTVNNVPGAWNGDTLELTVTNGIGQNTYSVQLVVNTNAPIITLQLPSPVTVVQGNSYLYSVSADGVTPLTYQWFSGASAGSQMPMLYATNATLTVVAGIPGTTYYSVTVSNQFGGLGSTTSQFISISSTRPTLTSGFDTNLLLLNPVGYWPMHETEAPAPGDIEANYGSLGVLGTGFYPNWATNAGGITPNVPGALPYDPDTAAFFNNNIGTGSTVYTTNELYIPVNTQLTTLNPPFTVECWVMATNNNNGGGQDVWAQFGDEGFETGNAGGTAGPYDGIQLVYNGGYTIYGEDNGVQTGMIASGTEPTNVWYYIVITCDAGTNFNFYLNGNSVGTYSGFQKYTPDYWTPITVGGGRGGTRSFAGIIDEFAVYTNVIGDISTHYQAGISGGPGQYFEAVTNDNPSIYLRMDAPNYNVPPMNSWPVMFNYGSAGNNGVYAPGTIPGEMPGPSTNSSGAAFNGLSGRVPMLSGVSSYADAGNANAYNPTGLTPFSVAAMFRGNPCDDRYQDIVGHSDNSWRISEYNGAILFNLGTNAASQLVSSTNYNDQNWHQAVAVYAPSSNPNLPGTSSLYIDGILVALTNNVTPNGILPGANTDVMIASDPQYTNNPAGIGRQFAGQVCEVALFSNALNAGEVSALYAATVNPNQVPAYVAPEPPLSTTVASGGTLSLTAGAAGTSNVGYQWQFTTNGGGTDVLQSGAGKSPLNANLSIPGVPPAWNGGQLELTVTNAYGTNSAFVALSVVNPINPNPTNIVFAVTNNQLYLSWPADHTGWQLQAQTNNVGAGLSTNWANYIPSTITNQVVIPVNLTNGTVFYRLTY